MQAPTRLRFEHRPPREPALGIESRTPRLSWQLGTTRPVTGTEIEIVRHPWGGTPRTTVTRVAGDEQVLVAWPAEPLEDLERATVRVRTLDESDTHNDWSEPAVVEAGLQPGGWTARFVTPATLGGLNASAPAVGTSFHVDGEVSSARLLITSHGWNIPLLNGQRATEDHLAPGWTTYQHRLRWYEHDVTSLVRQGDNTLDIVLGNGWWRGNLTWHMKQAFYGDRLAGLAQIEVLTTDGRRITVASDDSWHERPTNILADDMYRGQRTDLRLPLLGEPCGGVEVTDDSLETLVEAQGPAVRTVDVVQAQRVWRSPSGKLLVDFGQNIVGWVRLRTHGQPTGTEVVVRHAEVLEHEELGIRPLRNADATDTWILAGGDETLEPCMTFHGFRYAEVTGLDELDRADLEAVVISSAMERTGWFSSSHELVNQLHDNVVRGMQGNFVDVPTDCPQRDERLGWTGDIQVFSPTATYLYDSIGFLDNWTRDLACDQKDDGRVPIVSPDVLDAPLGACAWGDAATIVPWNLYLASGDKQILATQIDSMRGWVDWIQSQSTDDLWLGGFQFGDWLDPDAPPDSPAAAKADQDICATACWFRCADTVARAAAVLGLEEVEARYHQMAGRVRAAFQRRFVTPDGRILSDCQTVYAMAICWGLLAEQQVPMAGDRLADLVRIDAFRISTGFIGTPLVTEALSMTGHVEVAYRLLEQTKCPSWLYPVTMGATTIWERWDSMLPDGSINPGEMTSFNHYALGAVADWLHTRVAGLQIAEPGYRRLVIAPQPGGSFTSARTRHLTPYGEAAVSWHLNGDVLEVDVVVPAGSGATVRLPGAADEEAGPGEHHYRVEMPPPDSSRLHTVRDAVDDRALWEQITAAVVKHTPMPDDRPVAKELNRNLDQPAEQLGSIVTAAGQMPGGIEAMSAVDALMAAH